MESIISLGIKGSELVASRLKAIQDDKKKIENQILWCLKNVRHKIDKPVLIKFVWHEKTMKRDKDNVAFAKKFILDALQKSGILPNDNNKYIAGFIDTFVYEKCDKVVVEIKE